MAVQLSDLHKVAQGKETMDKEAIKPEVIKIGNTTVIIRSRLNGMTSEERREWFEREKKKGNPILEQISRAIYDCQR